MFVILFGCKCKSIYRPLEFLCLFTPLRKELTWVRAPLEFFWGQMRKEVFLCESSMEFFFLFHPIEERIDLEFFFFFVQLSKGLTWVCSGPFGLGKSDHC